jgi:hypothetical protein
LSPCLISHCGVDAHFVSVSGRSSYY